MKTHEDLYRIGTVARLTGVSVECLRAWERRYGLSPARRDGKTRFYNAQQVDRLKKIKRLIEQGHPIGSLTELSYEQLDARLSPAPAIRTARLPQVALVGPNLLILEQESPESDQVEVFTRWAELEDFFGSRPAERAALDVVVVHLPTLNPEALERVRHAAPDSRFIAVHQFASAGAIAHAQARGFRTLPWPVTWDELMRACATPAGMPNRAGRSAPRRFTDHELVAFASRAKQAGHETPRHLVGLIIELNAFVDYTTQCILDQPDAADVHDQIREEASYARAQLERALVLAAQVTAPPSAIRI